jgi:aryl-alcohol dehydrogenase-like predicted oxidoreductase
MQYRELGTSGLKVSEISLAAADKPLTAEERAYVRETLG